MRGGSWQSVSELDLLACTPTLGTLLPSEPPPAHAGDEWRWTRSCEQSPGKQAASDKLFYYVKIMSVPCVFTRGKRVPAMPSFLPGKVIFPGKRGWKRGWWSRQQYYTCAGKADRRPHCICCHNACLGIPTLPRAMPLNTQPGHQTHSPPRKCAKHPRIPRKASISSQKGYCSQCDQLSHQQVPNTPAFLN